MAPLLRENLCFFKKSLSIFGVYLDRETHERKRRQRTCLKFLWIPFQLLHTFRFYVEIYKMKPNVETWIVQGAVAYVVATALFYILLCFYANNQQRMLVEWCESRKQLIVHIENSIKVDDEEKFKEIFIEFKEYANARFEKAEKASIKVSKLLAFLIFTFYLSLSYTIPIYGYFNGEPWTLPFLLTLPYVSNVGPRNYFINWTFQVTELIVGCAAFFIFYTICAITVINLNAQLDVMTYLCQVLKSESIYPENFILTKGNGLKMAVLNFINQGKTDDGPSEPIAVFKKIDSKVVQAWIKVFVKIHNDTTDALTLFQEMSSNIFLMFYTVCYGSLFLIYFVLRIEKETYAYAGSLLSIPFILFLICGASESLIENFQKVMDALYGTPWFEMHPRDRRELVPLIQALQSSKAFKAGGMKDLTFNNYVSIINTAYSNCLVIQSLIE